MCLPSSYVFNINQKLPQTFRAYFKIRHISANFKIYCMFSFRKIMIKKIHSFVECNFMSFAKRLIDIFELIESVQLVDKNKHTQRPGQQILIE